MLAEEAVENGPEEKLPILDDDIEKEVAELKISVDGDGDGKEAGLQGDDEEVDEFDLI